MRAFKFRDQLDLHDQVFILWSKSLWPRACMRGMHAYACIMHELHRYCSKCHTLTGWFKHAWCQGQGFHLAYAVSKRAAPFQQHALLSQPQIDFQIFWQQTTGQKTSKKLQYRSPQAWHPSLCDPDRQKYPAGKRELPNQYLGAILTPMCAHWHNKIQS